jgi:putrescine oxidase
VGLARPGGADRVSSPSSAWRPTRATATGESLYVDAAGTARRFTGEDLPVEEQTAKEIDRLIGVIDDLAAQMDPDRPWEHPQAASLDTVSFAQWLDAQTDDQEARDNIALYLGPAMLTKPTWSFSALTAVLMSASAGSFTHLVDADFILDKRVVGGLASVPTALAERLGDRVRSPPTSPTSPWDESGATVTVDGEQVRASNVILALPPTHVRRIRIDPGASCRAPPRTRAPVVRPGDQGPGGVRHPVLARGRPVRHRLRSVAARARGLRQHPPRQGDRHPRRLRLRRERRRDRAASPTTSVAPRVLASLAAYFGEAALTPRTYVESDWQHQELTGGAYATSFDVGSLTRYGAKLHEPVGPIRFGSSDIAGHGFQHVDGAVRIGTRLAQQLLDQHILTPASRSS